MTLREKTSILSSVVLLIALAGVAVAYATLRIHVTFAREQIEVFETISSQADPSEERSVSDLQRAIREYYPSGTKQVTGSDLDWIVESFRTLAIEQLNRNDNLTAEERIARRM